MSFLPPYFRPSPPNPPPPTPPPLVRSLHLPLSAFFLRASLPLPPLSFPSSSSRLPMVFSRQVTFLLLFRVESMSWYVCSGSSRYIVVLGRRKLLAGLSLYAKASGRLVTLLDRSSIRVCLVTYETFFLSLCVDSWPTDFIRERTSNTVTIFVRVLLFFSE